MACHFHRRRALRTLPCGYVYDLSTPGFAPGGRAAANCFKFAKEAAKSHPRERRAMRKARQHVVHVPSLERP